MAETIPFQAVILMASAYQSRQGSQTITVEIYSQIMGRDESGAGRQRDIASRLMRNK